MGKSQKPKLQLQIRRKSNSKYLKRQKTIQQLAIGNLYSQRINILEIQCLVANSTLITKRNIVNAKSNRLSIQITHNNKIQINEPKFFIKTFAKSGSNKHKKIK